MGKLLALLEQFCDLSSTELPSGCCDCDPISIGVDIEAWKADTRNNSRFRPQGTSKDKIISDYVDESLANKLLIHGPPGLAGRRQVVTWRICIDYGVLNLHSLIRLWSIPAISDLLRLEATYKPQKFATLDLTSGFHQMALAPETIMLTAFIYG